MLNPFLVVLIKKKECTYGNMGIFIQGHSLYEILDSPSPPQANLPYSKSDKIQKPVQWVVLSTKTLTQAEPWF